MELKAKMQKKLRCATTRAAPCLVIACVMAACRPAPVSVPPSAEPQSGVQEPDTAKDRETDATSPAKPSTQTIARLLPESRIGAPEKDLASRQVRYDTTIRARSSQELRKAAWQYRATRKGEIVGFEFSNYGGNAILAPRRDAVKNQFFTRDFQFRFDERARQDIHLMVSDWVPSRDRVFRLSEIMNRVMLFFPRAILPAIVNNGAQNLVTLPTGEEIAFDADTHEIRGGVLSEAPVDLNPDRQTRSFPAIEYRGKGIMVRADARGTDPRVATTATIFASPPGDNCDGATNCRQCQVPSRELWDQTGAARFKFATDDDFDRYLQSRCGFALPKIIPQVTIALPAR
jgi:hypothetical protein